MFCHEFAGGYESWEPQVEYFSSRYQVVTWNVRGYPPSDVPESVDSYSQDASIEDLRAVMEALNISAAHLVGFSMGGNIALNFALKYPDRVTSLVIAGTGSGSMDPDGFRERLEDFAAALERDGMAGMEDYTRGPQRVQYMLKDPGGVATICGCLLTTFCGGCSIYVSWGSRTQAPDWGFASTLGTIGSSGSYLDW
ncbi:alpha/beta hydrolase [Dehalococcoidia bacterium]|nr:alpha/beta hydrolase [Dehalococcoidia bacterium]